jgi:hypothetical protein
MCLWVKLELDIVGRATLKMLRRKSKPQFVKQECNLQNAIAPLNYLKHIAPQQLMQQTQDFTKKIFSTKKSETLHSQDSVRSSD